MINIPTVFILGAGSSKPYGYPTGAELRRLIITEFYTELNILLRKEESVSEREKQTLLRESEKFIDAFDKSSIESIDKFLSLNPNFSYYGKLAIIISIHKREKLSKSREEVDYKQDWYKLLFNRMISSFNKPSDYDKFSENKVAFITFNYDRSLDHFIHESFDNSFLQNRHDIESAYLTRSSIDRNKYIPFPFIHVYGQVDEIKWYGGFDYKEKIAFPDIKRLSGNIRVIGERANNIDEITKIITGSKRIFFLGFGYAKENIESIGILDIINEDWKIYGTAKSKTAKEIEDAKTAFRGTFSKPLTARFSANIEDANCYELLRKYL